MKESIPAFASIFIIGTFASGAQGGDNDLRTIKSGADYSQIYGPAGFAPAVRGNGENVAVPILNWQEGASGGRVGYSFEGYTGNTEGYKLNRFSGDEGGFKSQDYGYNILSILMVSRSMPRYESYSYIHRRGTNYTNKSPIQLLPSRFPPPLEKLIQNIQNYFSTYNHPDLQNRPYFPQSSQATTIIDQTSQTTGSSITSSTITLPTESATEVTEETTMEEFQTESTTE